MEGFKVSRKFRGARYMIEVLNPDHVSRGIRQIRLEGKRIEGNILPVLKKDQTYQVQVIMGAS